MIDIAKALVTIMKNLSECLDGTLNNASFKDNIQINYFS